MPEPMITTTAMHPMMNLPCGRHVWFSEQKLMLAQSLWVSQVPLWILFHSDACVGATLVVFSSDACVGAIVVVSRLPKCLRAVLIGPYRCGELISWKNPPTPGIMANSVSPRLRPSVAALDGSPNSWGELSSWNTPPTPGIMETRVSSILRSSVLLAALAWFPITWTALVTFVCACLVAPSIAWTANESLPCGGLVGSPIVWPDLVSVPMMVIPIIRQLALQSDGEMLASICTMASFFSSFFF
jgi:hypothetical protein